MALRPLFCLFLSGCLRQVPLYHSIRHFKFCDGMFALSRLFYENSVASLDPDKSWLGCGA